MHRSELLNMFLACETSDPTIIPAAQMFGGINFMVGAFCLLVIGVLVCEVRRAILPTAIILFLMLTHPHLWAKADYDCGGNLKSSSILWSVVIVGVLVWGLTEVHLARRDRNMPGD